jgi:hypothetical protein
MDTDADPESLKTYGSMDPDPYRYIPAWGATRLIPSAIINCYSKFFLKSHERSIKPFSAA